jgi:hypothetical protein
MEPRKETTTMNAAEHIHFMVGELAKEDKITRAQLVMMVQWLCEPHLQHEDSPEMLRVNDFVHRLLHANEDHSVEAIVNEYLGSDEFTRLLREYPGQSPLIILKAALATFIDEHGREAMPTVESFGSMPLALKESLLRYWATSWS